MPLSPDQALLAEVEATLAAASLVEVRGLSIRALHRPRPGASRRFLLLHGNPSHLGHFARTIPFLAERGEVLAFDFPGFGGSEAPAGPLNLDFYADISIAVADHFGLTGPLDIIGQSHGGAVAQTILARHGGRARTGVALSSMGYPAHASMMLAMMPGVETMAMFGVWTLSVPILRPFGDLIGTVESWASFAPDPVPQALVDKEIDRIAQRPEIQRSSVRSNHGDPTQQLWAQAPQIRAPLLFLHAAQDRLVPEANARQIFERIRESSPRSQFRALEEGGHMVHLTRPALVHAELERWLDLTLD